MGRTNFQKLARWPRTRTPMNSDSDETPGRRETTLKFRGQDRAAKKHAAEHAAARLRASPCPALPAARGSLRARVAMPCGTVAAALWGGADFGAISE